MTNSGKAAGIVWINLATGGPEGNQSDYLRDLPKANLPDFRFQKPKSGFNTVKLPCGKPGIC